MINIAHVSFFAGQQETSNRSLEFEEPGYLAVYLEVHG